MNLPGYSYTLINQMSILVRACDLMRPYVWTCSQMFACFFTSLFIVWAHRPTKTARLVNIQLCICDPTVEYAFSHA